MTTSISYAGPSDVDTSSEQQILKTLEEFLSDAMEGTASNIQCTREGTANPQNQGERRMKEVSAVLELFAGFLVRITANVNDNVAVAGFRNQITTAIQSDSNGLQASLNKAIPSSFPPPSDPDSSVAPEEGKKSSGSAGMLPIYIGATGAVVACIAAFAFVFARRRKPIVDDTSSVVSAEPVLFFEDNYRGTLSPPPDVENKLEADSFDSEQTPQNPFIDRYKPTTPATPMGTTTVPMGLDSDPFQESSPNDPRLLSPGNFNRQITAQDGIHSPASESLASPESEHGNPMSTGYVGQLFGFVKPNPGKYRNAVRRRQPQFEASTVGSPNPPQITASAIDRSNSLRLYASSGDGSIKSGQSGDDGSSVLQGLDFTGSVNGSEMEISSGVQMMYPRVKQEPADNGMGIAYLPSFSDQSSASTDPFEITPQNSINGNYEVTTKADDIPNAESRDWYSPKRASFTPPSFRTRSRQPRGFGALSEGDDSGQDNGSQVGSNNGSGVEGSEASNPDDYTFFSAGEDSPGRDSGIVKKETRHGKSFLQMKIDSDFVKTKRTKHGNNFLQMNTDSARHTGTILDDLGGMESSHTRTPKRVSGNKMYVHSSNLPKRPRGPKTVRRSKNDP